MLGDTAIIGHLGTVPLAGLALGGLLLSEILGFTTFLEYGTTARAARLFGAGKHEEALDVGVQATWIALALGAVVVLVLELAAEPALELLAGGQTEAWSEAVDWFRIAALGAPGVLVTAAAQGWLRGFQDTKTPLVVLAIANAVSIVLSAALVYGADLGIEGSAVANALAQTASGAYFVLLLVRRGADLRPSWPRMRRQFAAARDLTVRTAAFFIAFVAATGVAARMGDAQVAAHQIGIQLWILMALILDSVAIAAQALIGRLLGAGATDVAAALARRLAIAGAALGLVFALFLGAAHELIPRLFTSDDAVLDQASTYWPFLVLTMPLNGLLFALDGIFFGAGDLRFMRNVTIVAALFGFLPITLATAQLDLGLAWLWAGLSAFIVIRLTAGLFRWQGGRWLVGGTELADEAS